MKMSLLTSAVFTAIVSVSSLVQAEPVTKRQATLFMWNTMITSTVQDTAKLESSVQQYATAYVNAGFFSIGEKGRLSEETCSAIQLSLFANAVSIAGMVQATEPDIKEIPGFNDPAVSKLTKITEYLQAMKDANESCANPSQSLAFVKKAKASITTVSEFLSSIK